MIKKHKKIQRRILVHVVTLGTFRGELLNTEMQFNTILGDPNFVNALTIVISVVRPSNTVPPTYMWPVAMTAVFMHTTLCGTRTVQTPGWAPHKIDIPILPCVSGVFLGSTSSMFLKIIVN